ncbi:MAG: hypothetical protein OXH99_11615 [Bryobacterales bacterium]|nr:hypothetical protein [Bryobacterales bacterium]
MEHVRQELDEWSVGALRVGRNMLQRIAVDPAGWPVSSVAFLDSIDDLVLSPQPSARSS